MTKKIFSGRLTTPGAGRVTVAELVGFYTPASGTSIFLFPVALQELYSLSSWSAPGTLFIEFLEHSGTSFFEFPERSRNSKNRVPGELQELKKRYPGVLRELSGGSVCQTFLRLTRGSKHLENYRSKNIGTQEKSALRILATCSVRPCFSLTSEANLSTAGNTTSGGPIA